jgi:intraflagellar transport protein 52
LALAERLCSCLREGEELPKDFTALFDDTMHECDTSLIPEAVELYGKLSVKKAALSLIAPQFETPPPPPQPAVDSP